MSITMKITKTLVTTIELEEADKKLLKREYEELKDFNTPTKLPKRSNKEFDFARIETITELLEKIIYS